MSKRLLLIVVATLVIAAVIAFVLLRQRVAPSAVGATAGHDSHATQAVGQEQTPRGEVALDTRRQQLIGVRTVRVERSTMAPEIRAAGTVAYDETRQAEVNTKVDGWIRELYADYTGRPVRRGEPLFTLYSPDLVATQNEYLLALRGQSQAPQGDATNLREYADRLVDAARERLLRLDMTASEIDAMRESGRAVEALTFTAPVSGVILEKMALRGMRVMAGQTLFKIADLSQVWVEAAIYEQEMPFVRVGGAATVTLDAYPGQAFAGRAIYIYPFVQEQSRTMKVRFQFANPGGRLKPGMFANVELRGLEHRGLIVPANAVLDSGTQQLVFVADGDGMFTPRRVKLGQRFADQIEILDGVKEGEQVATSATFFLDSESQLRAGVENYESSQGSQPAAGAPAGPPLTISFRAEPDPPKTGDNTFEVKVSDPSGKPVTDADVSVQLFMPAMPTMNMPAMRNETKLAPVGGGAYRGPGQVLMGGRWEVTVTVGRPGQRVASRQFPLVAK